MAKGNIDLENPLSADAVQRLMTMRQRLTAVGANLDKASSCGVDCRAEQAVCQALAKRVDALLHHFGSQRMTR